MFEKEEEKLADYKSMYDKIDLPLELLDEAIFTGFQRAKFAKKRKLRRKKWVVSLVAAAIFLVGFFTSIRLSPVFANYITVIPGMEKLVDLIRFDKGKMLAIENDYYEEIGVSEERNGLTFTIDGAIADEDSMILFYSIQSREKQKELAIKEMHLESADGEKLHLGTFSYGGSIVSEDGESAYNDMFEYHFQAPLKVKRFELKVKVKGDKQVEDYTLQFQIKKDIQKKKAITLNKTVTIEGQKMTFLTAKIYPLRVAVHVKMDPNNTKRLLSFEDLRLVDEHGETWNKIADGVTGSTISEDEAIIYLQSNYFSEPEKLYLVFNKIQAVDKQDVNVLIDTEKKQILKQPKGNHFSDLIIDGEQIILKMHSKDDFHAFPFSSGKDWNGNEFDIPESFKSSGTEITELGLRIPTLNHEMSPISLELTFFPAWIEGNGRIRIK